VLDFTFYNPTKIIFGKGLIKNLATELPKDAKILMLYGGGSIKKNGIYEQVIDALKGFDYLEFGGIPANPEYEVLLQALEIIKSKKITYLLAVGGGSVIDGVKFLSSAALYKGENPWDILSQSIRTDVGMPFATVLTLPATGSEMNSGSVITRAETMEKRTMGGPGLFPKFSILDPQVVKSIPERQLQNGIIDAYVHVMEQYLTYPSGAYLQDRIAEGILKTLIEIAPKLMKDPADYTTAANFMWSCTMALNGLIQKGVPTDWATHMIGHELTAIFGIDHARTLAIIAPSVYRYKFENKKEKLAQYAERIWDITEGDVESKAMKAIQKTEAFFQQLGVDTKLSAYTSDFSGTADRIGKTVKDRNWHLGERKDIGAEDVVKIVEMSY
jgi:NADP-dependent alcohol dehydrogenase